MKFAFAILLACVAVTAAIAQQTVPFRNNIPVAPSGIPAVPLPDKPVVYDTAEGQRIRVVVVTRGLSHPWSLAFLPDPTTARGKREHARDRAHRTTAPDPQRCARPAAHCGRSRCPLTGLSGLMDVALHPQFAQNRLVYLTYTKPLQGTQNTLALARGRLDGQTLTDVRDVFVASAGTGGASRIAFGRDGTIYMTTGGGGDKGAQDPNSHAGKVLRLRDDGSAPTDNPFVGRAGYKPEIYSLGHRNSLGLAIHPGTGELWQNENGPNGGDELNIIKPGRNYGWPIVSYGRTVPWPATVRDSVARRIRAAGRVLDAVDCRLGPGVLYRRSAAEVERRCLRRWRCAPARFRGRVTSSASCSTRRWRSCGASRCSSISASGSATSGRDPIGSCIC